MFRKFLISNRLPKDIFRKLSLGTPVRYEVTQQYGFLQKKKLSTSVVKQLFRYKLNRKEKPLLFHTIL